MNRPLLVGMAATLALAATLSACAPNTPTNQADALSAAEVESWTFDLYFVDMPPVESDKRPTLFAESVTVPNSGDKPLGVVVALLGTNRSGDRGVNGFNLFFERPIAEVNTVTVGAEAITVDLDREVWDPYPNVDCDCPPGDIVMQQLVWTINQALDTVLPVLLTVNGEPARGIWFERLDGPVSMEPVVSEPASVSTTLECGNNLRSTGTPDYALPAQPNTEDPLDQAARFVEGTDVRRDYPDVEIVLAEEQPTAQTIALVSHDKSIGILRYEDDDTLGWHLASTAQCSPAEERTPVGVLWNCQDLSQESRSVVLACGDGGLVIDHLEWIERSKRLAVAEGVLHAHLKTGSPETIEARSVDVAGTFEFIKPAPVGRFKYLEALKDDEGWVFTRVRITVSQTSPGWPDAVRVRWAI